MHHNDSDRTVFLFGRAYVWRMVNGRYELVTDTEGYVLFPRITALLAGRH